MKKTMNKAGILVVAAVLAVALALTMGISAFADGEFDRNMTVTNITATLGGNTVTGIYSDPVSYYEDSAHGQLTAQEIRYQAVGASDSVIYTPNWPKTTTGRVGSVTEYVCQLEGSKYVITQINTAGDGSTYIPIGGFVLSVSSSRGSLAKVGDEITLDQNLKIPTKAVESESGYRIVINNTNTTRSEPMVVYYDYQFGEKTGTNVFGTEMTCQYDFEKNTFVVTSFRPFGSGDDSGVVIPDNSFVLSAYGEGYRGLLVRNELFKVGDHVKMVGFDFIRFGGTVVGEYQFVNPTPEENPKGMETETSPFPAYRGENQTIIYKDGWDYNGADGTGTNVYGYEAAVDANGVVVELNVNVSKIPEGGYVISGHGKGRDFIRSNLVLGATVVLDEANKTYSVTTTLNSYYENLVTSVNNAVENAENAIKRLYDVDSATIEKHVADVKDKLEGLRTVKESIETRLADPNLTDKERLSLLMEYNNYQIQIERIKNQIVVLSVESRGVSARAVWHRPIEMTYAELEENIKMYKRIGINMIFVETWYNGVSTFKSSFADFPYNPRLADRYMAPDGTLYNDYLSAFTAICKANGIEVHAWVENFYISTQITSTILQNHPDWILYNDDGTYYQRNEGGSYIFIDPANQEVQDALIAYYLELFEKVPDVAGLNLDYIRYPVSDQAEDTGYTLAAMKAFGEQKGLTYSEAQLNDRKKMANKFSQLFDKNYLMGGQEEADKNYAEWVDFRMSVVTGYVERIKNEVKDEKDILLSTAVFASITDSKNAKKQDWQTWFRNGWIDIATPMAYYTDSTDVLKHVQDMILFAGNNCYYYSGLASSFSGLPAWQNTPQIEASYNAGANGYVIFCSTQILGHQDVQDVLASGVNRVTNAVLPHAPVQEVLSGYFNTILDRADRIYIPSGNMTQEQKAALQAEFDKILQMNAEGPIDIFKIQEAVKAIYTPGISGYAKAYAGQRITEQLKELVELLENKKMISLVEGGHWDPTQNPTPPTVWADGIGYPEPPVAEPSEPYNPHRPQAPVQEQPDNTLTIVLVCVGAAVVIAAAAVAVVLVRKKKAQ